MSKTANEIKEKIRAMTTNVVQCMIGTVISIDEDNAVCDVEVDGNTYYDVHLKSVMDENVKGIKILPAKDSIVLVERIGNSNELFVAMYSEVDAILWEIGDLKFHFDKDGFIFNGGDNKGMVKLPELVQKLNNMENKVNELIGICKSMTVALAPSGTYPLGTTFFASVQKLTTTQENELENKKIQH